MATVWTSFPCSTPYARWRYLDDGRIELEGQGIPLAKAWPPGVTNWMGPITNISRRFGVPAHWSAAVVAEESGGDPKARSPAGALGIMQIMPDTGRMLARSLGEPMGSDDDLLNPNLNLVLGIYYLASLIKRYRGDFLSAAVGYNAGSVKCLGSPTTKCTKGYWGVCTDGSDYPLAIIKYANSALLNGFPPTILPPVPLPKGDRDPLPPWAITATTAIGALVGYHAYQRAKQTIRPKRSRRGYALA
jgi:hypothetical protein